MFSFDFHGINVVITGSSRGLGKASAMAFAHYGANIALLGRNASLLQEFAGSLPKEQVIETLSVDLSQSDQVANTYHTLVKKISHIDLLINNAAGWLMGSLEQLSDDEISTLIATTMTGSVLITKHLLPLLLKGSNPHIINIISTAGLPNYQMSDIEVSSIPYVASKWGQAGFSESLRNSVKGHGIKVSSLYPGSFSNTSSLDDSDELTKERYSSGMLGVKDIVEAILFCAARPNIHSLTIQA